MLLRGQNVVGYKNYPDDIVQAFVTRAAANGIDVFRIFDAMNDIRNMKTAIEAGLKAGKLVEGAVCYTISPVHSPDYFLGVAEKLAEMGVQIICLKDMGGLLAPYAAYEIINKIKSRIALPLHHSLHRGLSPMNYMMAIKPAPTFSIPPSRRYPRALPSRPRAVVAALKDRPMTPASTTKLWKIADYFYGVRKNYAEFESPVNNQIKTDVLVSQIPGGMLSNLVAQLRQQKAEDKLDAVLAEMPHVRKDLGYPPLVTPTSQIVGSQAALNVMTGKRYSVVAMETRYVMGPTASRRNHQRGDQGESSRQEGTHYRPPGRSAQTRTRTGSQRLRRHGAQRRGRADLCAVPGNRQGLFLMAGRARGKGTGNRQQAIANAVGVACCLTAVGCLR
jgi:pyruvate carboxylase subunit B